LGSIHLACLARSGFQVIGVDIDAQKVEQVQRGDPTIYERGLELLIQRDRKRIWATMDPDEAIQQSILSLICVQTPSNPDGELDCSALWVVAETIGSVLRRKKQFHVIAIRSTVSPGTCEKMITILEQFSGKKEGVDFELIYHPEFLREGSAIEDYFAPGLIVLGSSSQESLGIEVIKRLYHSLEVPIHIVTMKTAEMIKSISNVWHALKVVFANECASICKELKIDAYEMMHLFCQDRKLNLSSAYLTPGFAYGGSCLPKDLANLVSISKQQAIRTPLLSSISKSNRLHIQHIAQWISSFSPSKILFLGISFKEGTNDLRGSANIDLVNDLLSMGRCLYIYDCHLFKTQVHNYSGHLIENPLTVLQEVDLVILANSDPEYLPIIENLPSHCRLIRLCKTKFPIPHALSPYENSILSSVP
jgi:GDP-mannose 6-dehydrogenase